MEKGMILEVKKKKEFSGLPDSIIIRALKKNKGDVKGARSWLRKYFGVFLTNRVLRGKGNLLGVHISSKKRDYEEFYGKIFKGINFHKKSRSLATRTISHGEDKEGTGVGSVVDLGCGVNGFSYEYLPKGVSYIGIEAAGQLVGQMNEFFSEEKFNARAIGGDLFDLDLVRGVLERARRKRVVFMFQVVDALENVKRDFSKELILEVMKNCEWLVISLPLVSLSGRKRFDVDRKWLVGWLREHFEIRNDFEMFGERILIIGK